MFGTMGVLMALYERERTGKGKFIKSALFETTAFFMGQHMAYSSLTEGNIPPMPARVSAWSIYRTFETSDDQSVFVGIISDRHWQRFCTAFDRADWAHDDRLATNNGRIDQRDWFLPAVEQMMAGFTKSEIIARCEAAGIPFAPIARPEDLFSDPQLNQDEGGLLATTLGDGTQTKLPRLPIEMEDCDFGLRHDPPAIGAHTEGLLSELGLGADEITQLRQAGTIA